MRPTGRSTSGISRRTAAATCYFHLDPLWASPDIDAIGIDLYWPLADWRDGGEHLDAVAGIQSIYDLAYLKSNISGGEGYDWYYASEADRGSAGANDDHRWGGEALGLPLQGHARLVVQLAP